MDCTSTQLPYRRTGAFSKIALDYIDQAETIRPFFTHTPDLNGIKDAIAARQQFNTNRKVLVEELKKQYSIVDNNVTVQQNIDRLLSPDTFTITTAHQNNIFTGPLYFIYKILHTVKLSAWLKENLPQYNFVPVYYIGSEDADLEELNHIHLNGEKLVWNTSQTGAVGRMKIDEALIKLVDQIEGQLAVLPFGVEVIDLLRNCYKEGTDIQTATFKIVNALFAKYGLLVLLPDNAVLKQQMLDVFKDDLLNQKPSAIVTKTSAALAEVYKVQAHPRAINLFYLKEDRRDRIELLNGQYFVLNTDISFTKEALIKELDNHPERFSPNVILRGLYQETILPNIIFIGGGGELAYWLELKDLFTQYQIPYPVQVLRNSFLLLENKWQHKIEKLGFTIEDVFQPATQLINQLVSRDSDKKLELNGVISSVEQLYDGVKKQAAAIDTSLLAHVDALKTKALKKLDQLEKKMFRAEKRKYEEQQLQLQAIRQALFPGDGLQERYDSILYYYAKWGKEIVDVLYNESPALERSFKIIAFNKG